jgi:hypothetical protein
MRSNLFCHLTLPFLLCLPALGCSEESNPESAPPSDAQAEQDAQPEAEPADSATEDASDDASEGAVPDGPDLVDLTVTVMTLPIDSSEPTPLEGATVAVDLPNGTRTEWVTDAAGKVTIPNAGAAGTTVVLVAHKPGYSVKSLEGPLSASARLSLYELDAMAAPSVTVSGIALSMTGKQNTLTVQATTSYALSQQPGNAFSLTVPPSLPFSLAGLEYTGCTPSCGRCVCQTFLGWTRTDHEAIDTDTVVDLDFGQSLASVQTTGTVELPAREESRLRTVARLYIRVHSFTERLQHGFPLSTEPTPDGNHFSYVAEHVPWDGAADTYTSYELVDYAGGAQSILRVPGLPRPDASVSGFIDVPDFTSPTDKNIHLLEPIEWEPLETTYTQLVIVRGGLPVWMAAVAGGSRLKLPQPPSSADVTELLGNEPLDAEIWMSVDSEPTIPMHAKVLALWGYKVIP